MNPCDRRNTANSGNARDGFGDEEHGTLCSSNNRGACSSPRILAEQRADRDRTLRTVCMEPPRLRRTDNPRISADLELIGLRSLARFSWCYGHTPWNQECKSTPKPKAQGALPPETPRQTLYILTGTYKSGAGFRCRISREANGLSFLRSPLWLSGTPHGVKT